MIGARGKSAPREMHSANQGQRGWRDNRGASAGAGRNSEPKVKVENCCASMARPRSKSYFWRMLKLWDAASADHSKRNSVAWVDGPASDRMTVKRLGSRLFGNGGNGDTASNNRGIGTILHLLGDVGGKAMGDGTDEVGEVHGVDEAIWPDGTDGVVGEPNGGLCGG